MEKFTMKMTKTYKTAKLANIGDTIICPACGKEFVKKNYNQVFCSNVRTKRFNNCKDKYWNTVDPNKRNNTTRISPANERYYREVIEPKQNANFDDDMGWDAHKDFRDNK
jgi:hypothetical protein